MISIKNLLTKMIELKGSDLFITAGMPLCMKAYGELANLDAQVLTAAEAKEIVFSLMDQKQQEEFINKKECNFALQTDTGRFRVNVFYQRCNVGAVLRHIDTKIPSLQDLQVPPILADLIMTTRGLIIRVIVKFCVQHN